jgi:hypothetical protein
VYFSVRVPVVAVEAPKPTPKHCNVINVTLNLDVMHRKKMGPFASSAVREEKFILGWVRQK